MATHVNLDALITREDFEVVSNADEANVKTSMPISDLEADAFFYGALRKPDFQRETAEWTPERVVGLIRTFIEGELIPGVILWKNRDLLFVIDGSHRLSALIAWVQDDYGDGSRSQEFFNHTIPEEQLKIAQRTRQLVEKEFGSYQDHRRAIAEPASFGPEIVARARRFGSLSLQLQWVRGNAVKAEDSFIRINQQAAMIMPQELELIKNRRKPNAIAARAIIRRGTGHKYWSSFDEETQRKIEMIATDLHKLVFEPRLRYPIKSLDLPAGGAVYSSTALPMVYSFINLCIETPSKADDEDGKKTIDYLTRCRRVMWLLLGNHPSSLGLHPAVYFYSWTGKQQPILFLVMAEIIIDLERRKQLGSFVRHRQQFEEFLTRNRPLLNQVIRKYGTKKSGKTQLRSFYNLVLELISQGVSAENIAARLKQEASYSYLQPEESPYEGTASGHFSTQVKSGAVMRQLLDSATRCAICKGFIPSQAISIDHKERREDGGTSGADNAQMTHPFCNTGVKESLHAESKASSE
jgi:hypothetical protein